MFKKSRGVRLFNEFMRLEDPEKGRFVMRFRKEYEKKTDDVEENCLVSLGIMHDCIADLENMNTKELVINLGKLSVHVGEIAEKLSNGSGSRLEGIAVNLLDESKNAVKLVPKLFSGDDTAFETMKTVLFSMIAHGLSILENWSADKRSRGVST